MEAMKGVHLLAFFHEHHPLFAACLFAATSDHLSHHPAKKVRDATDSCFALIGARQCGVSQLPMALEPILLDDRGGDHWLLQIGLRSPGHGSTLLTWSVGEISSDYSHLSLMPTLGCSE